MIRSLNQLHYLCNLTFEQIATCQIVEREDLNKRYQHEKEQLLRLQKRQLHALELNFRLESDELERKMKKEWSEWTAVNSKKRKSDCHDQPKKRPKLDETSDPLPNLTLDSDTNVCDEFSTIELSSVADDSSVVIIEDKECFDELSEMACIANSTRLNVPFDVLSNSVIGASKNLLNDEFFLD